MPETRPSYSTLALRNEVTDRSGSVILSATSEAALWRKEELLSPVRSRRWRSTSNGQQSIVGQFASAITPRLCALIDSNLNTPAGNIENALAATIFRLRAEDLDADYNDGDAIATWTTMGGVSFTQASAGAKPSFQTNEIDGKPVARFDGGDYLDYSGTIALGTVHTIAFVVKFSNVVTQSRILGGTASRISFYTSANTLRYEHDGSGFVSVSWTPTVSRWYCIRIVRNGTSVSFYVDGVQVGTTQTLAANTAFTLKYVGRAIDTSSPLQGDLADVIIATDTSFEANGYGLALQDYLYARYLGTATASSLTTMALSSLLLEFSASSTFPTVNAPRWALQSYAQTGRRVLKWYVREPDSWVAAAQATRKDFISDALDLYLGGAFWRLTLPSGAVLDSDSDGVVDAYHELGVVWFGQYTELPIDFGFDIEVSDPSMVSESDAGARFVDRLPTYHEISADSTANLEAVSYPLLAQIDAAGTSRHVLLDIWGPSPSISVRAQGCWYGFLGGGKGRAAQLKRKIAGRDDISISLVEARA